MCYQLIFSENLGLVTQVQSLRLRAAKLEIVL
jgi:hypothetical protein